MISGTSAFLQKNMITIYKKQRKKCIDILSRKKNIAL